MSLELANYFQILRLKALVREHHEFKEAVFHSPVRIGAGIILRALIRPFRNRWRRADILRRTIANRPPEDWTTGPRFIARVDPSVNANHVTFSSGSTLEANDAAYPHVQLDSGHDRAIFVHAFYEHEAQLIFDRLEQFPNYDLVLTTPLPSIRDAFLKRFDRKRAICVETPNHGRDILPFLLALHVLDLPRYRYFIKVHTKRSGHRSDGNAWFQLNLAFLLGSREISDAVFALVDADRPSLYGVECFPIQDHLENNRHWLEHLLQQKVDDVAGQFIPGSMFMGTGALLRRLAELRLHIFPMEAEARQLDGTLAHALERYVGYLAGQEGGDCLAIEAYLAKRGVA